jgi:type IV secretory pathway VirB2 component (pilin)
MDLGFRYRELLVWSAAVGGAVALGQVGLSAQGVGIPLLRSVNVIVDTILQIVRPVAVIALMIAGLMYMLGEGSVRWIANILFGGAIAVFAVSIVAAIF